MPFLNALMRLVKRVGNVIRVSAIYAQSQEPSEVELTLNEGSTIADAIMQLRLTTRCADWPLDARSFGVFGEQKSANFVLNSGDRIEFYRPLAMDPKTARRLRAASQGSKK